MEIYKDVHANNSCGCNPHKYNNLRDLKGNETLYCFKPLIRCFLPLPSFKRAEGLFESVYIVRIHHQNTGS